jgi:phosphopantothenoylcysteine decarboxylase/phosphopantothenate--cysteine ligase
VRLLITAGPTREPLDPVRYLSNHSTGRMGFALARTAIERGHEALLILGPVAEQPPVGSEVYAVETADEMLAAVLDFLPEADAVICAAAVCDYRPATRSEGKLKRGGPRTVDLVENPDIAAEVGERREGRPFAVFAMETDNAVDHALEKLERKGADWCVLNSPEAIGSDSGRFTLLGRDATARDLGKISKEELATSLLESMGL